MFITKENLPDFIQAYQKALDNKTKVFVFEGHTVLVGYARYVIEYLTDKL